MVNQGIGQYQDLFNPMNINQSGYTFEDISGIALGKGKRTFTVCSVCGRIVY